MREELREYLIWSGIMIGVVVLQITIGGMIAIDGVTGDFLLIPVVFIAVRNGQVPGMSFAFAAGLLLDLYHGELVGISSLALTAAAFAAGLFHDPERADRRLRSYSMVWRVFLAAVIRNMVTVFAYFQSLDFDMPSVLGRIVLLGALYTTLLASIPLLVLARSGPRLKI